MAARPDLFHEEFDTALNQKGIECSYQPAIVCECITHDSNQPLFSCPLCGGSGYRYLPAKDIRVLVTSFASKTESEMIGLRESGTAYATPPSDIIMGFHDRLVFPKFECKYSERIWIKKGKMISTKTYRNIKRVEMLLMGNSAFELGVDFEVDSDTYHIKLLKPIEELMEESVYEDVPLSILYYTTPSYLVVDLLHELRATYTERHVPTETFVELPKQYRLRREDFIYNVGDSLSEDEAIGEKPDISSGGLFD